MTDTDAAYHPNNVLVGSSDFRRTAPDEEFDRTIEAHSVVDIAVGIVMGKHNLDRTGGLVNLQRTARTFNITVLELARGLVSASGRK